MEVMALAKLPAEVFCWTKSLKVASPKPAATIAAFLATRALMAVVIWVVRAWTGLVSERASVSERSAEPSTVVTPALVAETTASEAVWMPLGSPLE